MAKFDKHIRFHEKHGPLYRIWVNMKTRCTNPNYIEFKHYGGRGINFEPRWKEFANFKMDMEKNYFKGLQLDRIDNNKGYFKSNCRWSTPKEQQNNRRNNHLFTFFGISDTLTNWADYFHIKNSTLKQRVYVYKWPIEKALDKKGVLFG